MIAFQPHSVFAKSPEYAHKVLLALLLFLSATLHAEQEETVPPILTTVAGQFQVAGMSFDGDTLLLTTPENKDPAPYPAGQLRGLRFPPGKEKLLARADHIPLQAKEKNGVTMREYPEKLLLELEIPKKPSLYLTPFAIGMGDARQNTFRIWAGETYLDVQGRGSGKTAMTSMENWRKPIPSGPGEHTLLQFYFDRKAETCVIRINHQFVHEWKMPTSYEADPQSDTATWFRAGQSSQFVSNLRVWSWTHNQNPKADLSPLKDREKIWLQNGDVVEAELLSIQDQTATLQLTPDVEIPLPLERILEIHFRQPESTP